MTAWQVPPPHSKPEPRAEQGQADAADGGPDRANKVTSRTDLEALLDLANQDTHRLPRIVEKFSANRDHWTPWSQAHDYLNDLLTEWENAPAPAPAQAGE